MKLTEIKPFIRYAHYMTVDKNSNYSMSIPYDNRIFYMFSGCGKILTDTGVFNMDEGDILIIPSGKKYQLMASQNRIIYIGINFDYTQINVDKTIPIPPEPAIKHNPSLNLENIIFDVDIFNNITHIKRKNKLSSTFVDIEREYATKLLYFENIISYKLCGIIFECARSVNENTHNNNGEISNTVMGFINENFNKNITYKSIGNEFNLHPNYISKLIKAATGMPLHQYLINSRVYHSIQLLNQKKYTISEIAEKCGFCDIYHYSKAFKNVMGVPPSKYI